MLYKLIRKKIGYFNLQIDSYFKFQIYMFVFYRFEL